MRVLLLWGFFTLYAAYSKEVSVMTLRSLLSAQFFETLLVGEWNSSFRLVLLTERDNN